MQCPVCDQDLVIVEADGVELDVCAAGHGLWFDAGELQQILHAELGGEPAFAQVQAYLRHYRLEASR